MDTVNHSYLDVISIRTVDFSIEVTVKTFSLIRDGLLNGVFVRSICAFILGLHGARYYEYCCRYHTYEYRHDCYFDRVNTEI